MKGVGGKGDWGGGGGMQNNISSCLCRILCYLQHFRGWVGIGAGGGGGQKSSLSYNSIIKARPHNFIS